MKKTIALAALISGFALLHTPVAEAQSRDGHACYHYRTKEMITAARYEPVGSVLDVTNPQNGRTVRVRVAGRGPYNGRRVLDLSTGAFAKLYGGLGRGVGPVRYTVVSRGGGSRERSANQQKQRRSRKQRKR